MGLCTPRLIVFDLDGTLIDSRLDLCNSVNATLAHLHRLPLPHSVISAYVGDGVASLVSRALRHDGFNELTDEHIKHAVDFFLNYYREHKFDFTYVYHGAREALEEIHSSLPDVLMAVLTNKPVIPSREICSHFGLDHFFFQNYGGNSFPTKKPNPEGLMTLMQQATSLAQRLNQDAAPIRPQDTIMVGDSDVDVMTARSCNASSVGCTFGLSPESLLNVKPDLLANAPSEWPRLVGARR